MKIFLYDSLSKTKKEFVPIDSKKIRIYACGPTVYNYAHIGNARMSVVTDLLVNILKTKFQKVVFVSNITDVDDKIIESSQKNKKDINIITNDVIKIFHENCKSLNCLKPTSEPKATEHIKGMITMTENLLKNNHAYEKDNHVYFSINSFKNLSLIHI